MALYVYYYFFLRFRAGCSDDPTDHTALQRLTEIDGWLIKATDKNPVQRGFVSKRNRIIG